MPTETPERFDFEARLCRVELSDKVLDTEDPENTQWESNPKVTVRGKSCCMMHFTLEQMAKNPWLATFIFQGRIFRVYGIYPDGEYEFMSYFMDFSAVQRRDIEVFDKQRGL